MESKEAIESEREKRHHRKYQVEGYCGTWVTDDAQTQGVTGAMIRR